MPGDGFTFAVKVSRQKDRIGLARGRDDLVDMLLVALDDVVAHGEVVVGIDRAFFGHQVAHVTVGGQDLEIRAQVLVDGGRLGRRLDDEKILGHCLNLLVCRRRDN
jgi:hypothetical protein